MDALEPIPLNGPQRLHFEVILASLEDALARVELIAQGRVPRDGRRLTRVVCDLPEGFLADAAPRIASLRAYVAALSDALALEGSDASALRTARALLTSQVIHLEDSDARRLRGYGTVDPLVRERLDPVLETMRSDVQAILDLLHRPERAQSIGGAR